MNAENNSIILGGLAGGAPEFSHLSHGRHYFIFPLRVRRLSGAWDVVNVVAEEAALSAFSPREGDFVTAEGQVRSFNNRSGQGSRLVITVLAETVSPGGEFENRAALSGSLCKPPVFRKTPLGREICDLMLAVPRPYGRADYLPCIAWGENARVCSGLLVGDPLEVRGRLQSRVYIKTQNGESVEKTAYEISAVEIR